MEQQFSLNENDSSVIIFGCGLFVFYPLEILDMTPLRVYLCDLTHETVILVSDTIPVNLGYIGSYAKKIHGDSIEISLFKYPNTAIDAIKKNPPDILGLL